MATEDKISNQAKPGQGRSILVVDDSVVQRKLLDRRLNELGFRVVTAQDGAEALELARASPPDAIVSDVVMPRLDGFELCRAVRQDPQLAGIPLVLASATDLGEADLRLAESSGANAFVRRTPGLQEVTQALLNSLRGEAPKKPKVDSLSELRGIFFSEGQNESRMLLASLESGFDFEKARRIVHRWVGRGGTLGFPQISEQALKIDSLLKAPSSQVSVELRTDLERIAKMFTELAPVKYGDRHLFPR